MTACFEHFLPIWDCMSNFNEKILNFSSIQNIFRQNLSTSDHLWWKQEEPHILHEIKFFAIIHNIFFHFFLGTKFQRRTEQLYLFEKWDENNPIVMHWKKAISSNNNPYILIEGSRKFFELKYSLKKNGWPKFYEPYRKFRNIPPSILLKFQFHFYGFPISFSEWNIKNNCLFSWTNMNLKKKSSIIH